VRLKEIQEREQEDPDQIHKMPEETTDFDSVSHVLRVLPQTAPIADEEISKH
jgi:hypothetical protein